MYLYTFDIHGMRDAIPLSVITDEDLQLRQVREGWTLKNTIHISYTDDAVYTYLNAINNSFVI